MKKIAIFILLFFHGLYTAFAVVFQTGTLPYTPDYAIVGTNNMYYVSGAYTGGTWYQDVYDKSGTQIRHHRLYINDLGSSQRYAVETKENDYFLWSYQTGTFSMLYVLQYNKATDTFAWIDRRSNTTGGTWTNNNIKIIADDGAMFINGGTHTFGININNVDGTIQTVTYAGDVPTSSFVTITNNLKYILQDNLVLFLNDSLKTLDYYITGIDNSVLYTYDTFVSIADLRGFDMLVDSNDYAYLSLYGNTADYLLRGYYNYEFRVPGYNDNEYYLELTGSGLVTLGTPTAMGVPYTVNHFNLNIGYLQDGQLYRKDSTNNMYTDGDLTINFMNTYSTGGGTGTGGTSTGTGVIDDTIWDWDFDGDGDVEFLNGEVFIGIAGVIKAFFNSIVSFFNNLKDFFAQLMTIGTDDVKTLGFFSIPQANATLGEDFTNISMDTGGTTEKIYLLFKGFLLFILFGLSLLAIILFKKR